MANKLLLVTASVALFMSTNHHAGAGGKDFAKELVHLNALTGTDATRGALKMLVDDPKQTKALLAYAAPLAKKGELSYNAALVFGLTAAEMKDMKSAEVFFRVCMDRAVKLQSFEKMKQSYGLLIELNFDYKNYADASRLCRELLELNTEDGKQRLVIRMMVDRFGQLEFREPQDSFDTAQRLRPYVYEIYIKSTTKQGKFDQAIKLVDGLLKKNNDWIDRHLKGWVLREAGKFADAATVYEDVIKQVTDDRRLEPEEKDIYIERFRYEVSNVYVDLKQIDRASEHLEYLVKKRPNDPVFYNDLGFVWADNNMKLEEAEKLIRKALELDRERRQQRKGFDPKTDHDNGAYLDSLGWVLFKQKKNDEAKKWLIKALEDKNAQHIEIYDHLGDVHIASGERDLAIKAWQKGLEVVTDNRRDQERKVSVERKIEKAKAQK